MSIARYERAQLATLLGELGPDAPTLCEGWTTRDLAAHLLARERRADAAVGLVVAALAGHTASVQEGYARRPYDELVTMVRDGPPRWSAFGWGPADRLLNTTEYLVHHEDVRRARQGWTPRRLPATVQDRLWLTVRGRARMALRHLPGGVELRRPDGTAIVAREGEPRVTLTGEPAELLLYLFGRRDHARLEIDGPPEVRDALDGTGLTV
ncbi:MAG: hypothetical protein QOI54_1333 [Actinomycetota bacterium]|jgi:uncharacterized protein (TIGR03085 family)|nr:hypothetical protein [Actinomycetota bacterium]